MRKRDEEQRRTGGDIEPEGKYGGDDNACGHETRNRVENGDVARSGHHIDILLEIAAIDERAATGKREAEDRLAKRVHPGGRIEQRLPARHEQV